MATKAQLRKALARVAKTQKNFWDAMGALERLSGVDLDSSNDYIDYTEPTDEDVDAVFHAFKE